MHHHHHDAPLSLPDRERRRVRIVLSAITVPLVLATLVGLLLLWPQDQTVVGSQPMSSGNYSVETARITSIDADLETGGSTVRADLLSGIGEGQNVEIQVSAEVVSNGLAVGDVVRVLFTADALGTGSPYVFWDFERTTPLIGLVVVYLLVVVAVARWKGLAAVLGLAASLAVVFAFIIPAIMEGKPAILVMLVGSAAMLLLAVYLAHGVSIRTTTAVLGTFAGLAVTVVLALGSVQWAHLTGAQGEDGPMLAYLYPDLSLRHVLVAGMVISALGALNDVTITQASAVWELHAANPELSRRRLATGAMRIGRDHIASTIYTLAFAYVGGALTLLLMAMLVDTTAVQFLTNSEVAEEIVGTLVASIGLILAIPFTTFLGAALVRSPDSTSSTTVTAQQVRP